MKPALIDRKRKLIMAWSPKAGCTVAVKMFFAHMGLLDEAMKYHNWVHVYRERVFYKAHPQPTEAEWGDPTYYKFKVVRNPYDRAVSGFLAHYVNVMKNTASFTQFLDVLNDRKMLANMHFAPQTCERRFDRIVQIENFAHDITRINHERRTTLATNFDIEHGRQKRPQPGEYVGDKIFSRPLPDVVPAYDDFYTPSSRATVAAIYRADFKQGGYPT